MSPSPADLTDLDIASAYAEMTDADMQSTALAAVLAAAARRRRLGDLRGMRYYLDVGDGLARAFAELDATRPPHAQPPAA